MLLYLTGFFSVSWLFLKRLWVNREYLGARTERRLQYCQTAHGKQQFSRGLEGLYAWKFFRKGMKYLHTAGRQRRDMLTLVSQCILIFDSQCITHWHSIYLNVWEYPECSWKTLCHWWWSVLAAPFLQGTSDDLMFMQSYLNLSNYAAKAWSNSVYDLQMTAYSLEHLRMLQEIGL